MDRSRKKPKPAPADRHAIVGEPEPAAAHVAEPTVPVKVGAKPGTAGDAPVSLWRNRPYMALLTGETVGGVGVEIAQIALPIIAVTFLVASEVQIGILAMAEGLAFLLLALPVGAWVDRVSRRKVMIVANLVRGVTMAVIPVLWLTGTLRIHWLMVIALIISAAQVFFDMAYMSIVPGLVPRSQLNDANSRLQITAETARAAGPGLGGLLAKFVSASILPIAATIGYFASALAIWRIPADEPHPRKHDSRLRDEIREGMSFVWRHWLIRPVVYSTATSNFFGTMAGTMMPVLLLRYLEVGPGTFGLLGTVGAVGGVSGAFLAPWYVRKFGAGHAIPITALVVALGVFPVIGAFYAPRTLAIVLVGAAMFMFVSGIVSFNVVQVTMRQGQCPPRLLGRMTASIRTIIWGVGPLGALASGFIATHWGLQTNFWIGFGGSVLAFLILARSPLWRMREIPEPDWMKDEAKGAA